MQLTEHPLKLTDPILTVLVNELSNECSRVLGLISQLQLPEISPDQKSDILAELLASTIHLHSHCDEDFQSAIAQELEQS